MKSRQELSHQGLSAAQGLPRSPGWCDATDQATSPFLPVQHPTRLVMPVSAPQCPSTGFAAILAHQCHLRLRRTNVDLPCLCQSFSVYTVRVPSGSKCVCQWQALLDSSHIDLSFLSLSLCRLCTLPTQQNISLCLAAAT